MINQMSQVRNSATSRLRAVLGGLVIALSLSVPAWSQSPPQGGTIDAKFIDGYIFLPVLLQTEVYESRSHVMVDLSAPDTFAGHDRVLSPIGYGEGETTLKLLADGFRLEVNSSEILPVPAFWKPAQVTLDTSSRYDRELENVAVFGVLGYPAFEGFKIELDPVGGTVTLTPASENDRVTAESRFEHIIDGVEVESGRIYAPVSYGRGQSSQMLINSSTYHTFLEKDQAIALGAPEGDLEGVSFGDDGDGPSISDMTALYPYDFSKLDEEIAQYEAQRALVRQQGGPAVLQEPVREGILLRSGMNLLNGFNVELNPSQGYMALTRQVDSRYSKGDAAFYAAAGTDDVPRLQAFFKDFAGDRNVEEAGKVMFDLVLDQELGGDLLIEAVESGLEGVHPRFKTTRARAFVEQLSGDGELRAEYSAATLGIAEVALKHIGRSLNPGQRTMLQLTAGDLNFEAGRAREAWKLYLSAAFNRDPELDDTMRLRLGRVYEEMGRDRRAYGSYQRAATSRTNRGSPTLLATEWLEAIEGLRRLGAKLETDDSILVSELSLELLEARGLLSAQRLDEGEAMLVAILERREELSPEELQDAEGNLQAVRSFRARQAAPAESAVPAEQAMNAEAE